MMQSHTEETTKNIGCFKINVPNFEKQYLKKCLSKFDQIWDPNDIIELQLLLRSLSWYIMFSGFDSKTKIPNRKNK